MVLVFMASMAAGVVRQYQTYSTRGPTWWAFSVAAGWPTTCWSNRTQRRVPEPAARRLRTARPLGRDEAGRFHAQRIAGTHCGRGDPDDQPQPGTDYGWDQPIKLSTPGVNGSTVPLPAALDPAGFPWLAATSPAPATEPAHLGLRTSCRRRRRPPAGGRPAAGTIAGDSVLNAHTDGQLVGWVRPAGRTTPVPAGRVQPYDIGPARPVTICATTLRIPADAPAVASWPPTGRWAWATGSPSRRRGCRSYGRCRYVGSTSRC